MGIIGTVMFATPPIAAPIRAAAQRGIGRIVKEETQ